jgi:3-oxoacyl-[acyl-carrier protein] reductase
MRPGLQDKRTVIFGASSGIGAAVARRFAARGAHVLVHFNSKRAGAEAVVAEIRDAGGKAGVLGGDVSDGEVAARLV